VSITIGFQDIAYLEPVHPRQHQIEQDEVRHVALGLLQGLLARRHGGDVESPPDEVVSHQFDDIFLVIDNQHVLTRHDLPHRYNCGRAAAECQPLQPEIDARNVRAIE
jgi:hypothetical protein